MPLARYGMLAGRVVDRRSEGGTDTPHYQVHVRAGGDRQAPKGGAWCSDPMPKGPAHVRGALACRAGQEPSSAAWQTTFFPRTT